MKTLVLLIAVMVVTCAAQAAAPDLIVTSSIGLNPNPVTVGINLVVSYTVKNNGNATAPLSHTRIQIKPGSSTTTLKQVTNNTPSLAVGASVTDNVTIPIPSGAAPGGYTVYVILDFDNAIGQTTAGQANDIYQTSTSALTIQAAPTAPDLIVTSSIGLNPNPVTVGSNLVVGYTVKNSGNAAAPQSHTRIQVKFGSSSTTLVQVTNNIPALAAGASTTDNVTILIPSGAALGGYTVYMILDFGNAIGQTTAGQANDIYQTSTSALTIQAAPTAPDLIVTSSIALNPNPVTAGSNLVVGYTVKNSGDAAAALSHTRIQVKLGSGSDPMTFLFFP